MTNNELFNNRESQEAKFDARKVFAELKEDLDRKMMPKWEALSSEEIKNSPMMPYAIETFKNLRNMSNDLHKHLTKMKSKEKFIIDGLTKNDVQELSWKMQRFDFALETFELGYEKTRDFNKLYDYLEGQYENSDPNVVTELLSKADKIVELGVSFNLTRPLKANIGLLQRFLNRKFQARLAIDGDFGPLSQAALNNAIQKMSAA